MNDKTISYLIDAAQMRADKNDGYASIEITLLCGGVLVSGEIIGTREYSLHDVWTEAFDESDRKNKDLEPMLAADGFIHLKNVFFFSPSGGRLPSGDNGVFWRGRLDRIDGFTLGSIKIKQ